MAVRAFCRAHTYLVTVTNFGANAFDALRAAFLGKPFTLVSLIT